jgi:large subunit ribosomal protein L6
MSRIGKIPVIISQGVKVDIKDGIALVEGPKGKLSIKYRAEIKIENIDGKVIVTRINDTKKARALHGLYRNLINNMVKGVSEGFKRILVINGVGYRAEKKGTSVFFNLGYSNPIEYPIPQGISIDIEANNRITVGSIDKEKLGQVCAEIRSFRPPEPYKGKGIKYDEEHIRKKVGKTGVK